MTFAEKGAYIELLCEQADCGHLSMEEISRVLKDDLPIWDAICCKFTQDKNGFWYNLVLEEHMEKRQNFVSSRINNLNKGKHMSPHMGRHMVNVNENVNVNVNKDINKVNKGVVRGGFDFDSLWAKYPNKDGKKAAERHFHNEIKNDQDWQDINTAIKNYLESDVVKKGFIKNGSTWFNNWRDWIVPPRKEETDGIPDNFKHLVTKSFPNSR